MAMKDNFLRKYVGTGDLTFSFCSLKKCAFELHCYNEGRLRLICDTIASQDFFEILKHDTDKNKVAQLQASLHGKTNDGDEITIAELFLDNTTFSSKDNTTTIHHNRNITIDSSDPFPIGVLVFIPLSEIDIVHSNIDEII